MTIRPLDSTQWPLVATLVTPAHHGDPDHVITGNFTPFRRRQHLVPLPPYPDTPLDQDLLDDILSLLPLPQVIAPTFTALNLIEFLSVAVLHLFIEVHRSIEGIGRFTGSDRYLHLHTQVTQSARRTTSLHGFWSDLTEAMQVGGMSHQLPALFALFHLPRAVGYQMLVTLATQSETTIMYARKWTDTQRQQDPTYAQQAGLPTLPPEQIICSYHATDLPPPIQSMIRLVPAISGNALRHVLFRQPAILHLLEQLGMGREDLPPGVGRLLWHGGAMRKGSKAPDNDYHLGQEVRERYPPLELLGGTTDAFFLPPSALRVNAYVVCLENAEALAPFGIAPEYPAEALMDRDTLTRASADTAASRMIFTFETMIAGTQILVVPQLTPYASALAQGVLAAVLGYLDQHPLVVGGKGAVGYGSLQLDLPWDAPKQHAREQYEHYLQEHREALVQGLRDRTLGTNQILLTE